MNPVSTRDTETALDVPLAPRTAIRDYFGARYYAPQSSLTGRFLSPDWSATVEPVPYGKLGNPQTLNLYAYVADNRTSFADPDGHHLPTPPANRQNKADSVSGGDQTPTAQQQNQAHGGISVGLQVGENAALGVGKTALGATGSAAVVPVQIDAKTKHPNVAAEASGGVIATEGPHVAGHPQQDRSNTTIGAFAGVEGGLLLSNAGNAPGLKQPSETLSVDFGWGAGASVSWTISNGSIVSVNVGVAFGFGAAFSDINTATAAAGTNW